MQKKKLCAILLVFSLCIGVLCTGCGEQAITGDAKIKYKIENGEATVREFPDESTVISVEIPDEYEGCPVTVIADFAAVNLENVETIYIGKNVREIGPWAFENNQKLQAFKVSAENAYFCDVDGVLYTKDMKTLLFYPPARGKQTKTETDANGAQKEVQYIEYTIPDGVETIRTKAFYKCQSLTAVTIPDSVTRIEEKAFFRCALKAVQLPENLTFIGKDAFAYCGSLQTVEIPASIEQIDEYAFYNCTSLKSVHVLAAESEITLGQKWYPTDNGRNLDGLEITWAQ
ncbi:MAG: leucine-rich repeat domain-containing protein [Candidatus Fimenecus sp.]